MPTDLSDLFNAPAAVTLPDGRTVAVGELTLERRARFVRWLKDRAVGELARLPEDAPPAVVRAYTDAVSEALAVGVYEWGGSACVRALAQRPGGSYALFLAVEAHDPLFTVEEAEALWDAMVADRMELLRRAVADPPASAA
jgi:hypothetical protein